MSRKPAANPEQVLNYPIIMRVNEATWNKLDKLREQSDCATIGEVARRILTNRQLKLLHKDVSMNSTMEELALIRKELKAIGININQITRGFNQDKGGAHKAFYILKAESEYRLVGVKVDRLLTVISQLADKWLQG
jgi:hypothetical protein